MADEPAPLVRRGRCHVLGDDVSLDDGIIPARFAVRRVTDPTELIPYLFEAVNPDLAERVSHGDIILAGRNFAGGKPRLQGLIAMAALDLSIVCVSMPYKILRRAVARAVPVVTGVADPHSVGADGDELEIDFSSGAVRNLTKGTQASLPPMPPVLVDIVDGGGAEALLRDWLARHPEQAA